MLAGAVDARERLLVQEADEAVASGDALERLHRQLLVVDRQVGVLEHRGDLVLGGRDLVVARLDRHAELGELILCLQHAGEDALGDGAEVVVVELVALRRLGAEQRAAGRDEVGAREEVGLVDQEVLLLVAHRREDSCGGLVAEQPQGSHGGARQRVHRSQQGNLEVERLAGPARERRGDAEHRAVGVLEDEGRAGRVPGRVAARLEGGADAAGREARGVRLATHQVLAGELGDRGAVAKRAEEGVVLLRRRSGERLEPVRVVARPALHRPLAHRGGDAVGELRVELLAALERQLKAGEHGLRQVGALRGRPEHVEAEDLVLRSGEVARPEGCAVVAPLRGGQVALGGR